MSNILCYIIDRNLQVIPVILVILLLRILFHNCPKKYSYILWLAVPFRLFVPVLPCFQLSLFELFYYDNDSSDGVQLLSSRIPLQRLAAFKELLSEHPIYVAGVWLAGIFFLAALSFLNIRRLKRTLADTVLLEENIYMCRHIKEPFTCGLVKPKIFLPENLNTEQKKCVLLHEQMHIRRHDLWLCGIFYAVLLLNWFNPFIWLAHRCFVTDCECSCDEAVLKKYPEIKRQYARTLLEMTVYASAAMPALSFDGQAKRRLTRISHWKAGLDLRSVIALCIMIFAFSVLCSAPVSEHITLYDISRQKQYGAAINSGQEVTDGSEALYIIKTSLPGDLNALIQLISRLFP